MSDIGGPGVRSRTVNGVAVAVIAVSCLLIGLTLRETTQGQLTADTNQYLTVVKSYATSGDARLGAYREPLYQWLIYGALKPAIERGGGWSPQKVQWTVDRVAAAQTALYWVLVAGFCLVLLRGGGLPATAAFLLLVAADNYEYQWIPTVMSEAPAKLAFLAGMLLLAAWSRSRRGWQAVGGALLVGLCPLFRGPDIAVSLAVAGGAVLYAVLALRGRRLVLGLAGAALLVLPTIAQIQVMGATTGFYGISPISAWLLSGRVLSITDPAALQRAGVDPALVDAVARRVYAGGDALAGRPEPMPNDLSQPDGVERIVYPLDYRTALSAMKHYRAKKGLPPNDFLASEALRKLATASILAVPGPMVRTTLDLWRQHAVIPFLRNLKDRSWRNNLRLIFYASVLVAAAALTLYLPRRTPPLAWGWLAASVVFLPGYTLISAIGQNYQPKYGNHPYFYLGLMAFMAVYVKWLAHRRAAGG